MIAEAGDPVAQLKLGMAYEDGNGVAQKDSEAVKWYRKAAEQGNATAQNDLGLMYWSGRGVEKNKQEAVSWYLKSARQKNSKAMFNIAVAYYNGEGVPATDNVRAYAWFSLAREAGNKLAADGMQRLEIGMMLGGVDDALLTIAEMYEKGENLDQDFAEAAKWYRKAAEKRIHPAQVKLAGMLIAGQGVTQDYREARHWCEVAAKEFSAGMYCVGRIYRQGLGVTKDPEAAAKWLQRAAYYGEGDAMSELGEMYWNGIGVKRDKVTAYMWTLMAFSARIPGARESALLLKKEMNDREVDRAKKKALEFLRTRPFFRLREPVSPEAN